MIKHEHFDCICSDFNHTIRFSYDPSDNELWLEVRLSREPNIFKRILNAIRYAFNIENGYGEYDVWILNNYDKERLIKILEKI